MCIVCLFGIHDDVLGMSISAARALAQQDLAISPYEKSGLPFLVNLKQSGEYCVLVHHQTRC